MDKVQLGKRIKDARSSRALTIDELATAVGVNKSTISRYERGEIETPKLPVIEAIANVLSVNPSWLIGKSNDMTYTPKGMVLSIYTPCNLFSALRSIRESFGMTPSEVAYEIGISEADYLSIEKGRDTSCLVLARLATLFCCSTDFILSFDGVSNEEENIRQAKLALADPAQRVGHEVLSTEEADIIHKFRALSDQGRARILNALNLEYEQLPGEKANSPAKNA